MGKHKRHTNPENIMDNSAMYPPGMMGPNMNPNMMNPNMMNGNMNQPNMGQMPFNQNPSTGNSFFDMLGNTDFSQLASLLNALTSNGVNLNDINLGNTNSNDSADEDSTIKLLNALRPFMPIDKVGIIDKVIQMYSNGELND